MIIAADRNPSDFKHGQCFGANGLLLSAMIKRDVRQELIVGSALTRELLSLKANAEIVIYTLTDPGSGDQDGNRSCGHVSCLWYGLAWGGSPKISTFHPSKDRDLWDSS